MTVVDYLLFSWFGDDFDLPWIIERGGFYEKMTRKKLFSTEKSKPVMANRCVVARFLEILWNVFHVRFLWQLTIIVSSGTKKVGHHWSKSNLIKSTIFLPKPLAFHRKKFNIYDIFLRTGISTSLISKPYFFIPTILPI